MQCIDVVSLTIRDTRSQNGFVGPEGVGQTRSRASHGGGYFDSFRRQGTLTKDGIP